MLEVDERSLRAEEARSSIEAAIRSGRFEEAAQLQQEARRFRLQQLFKPVYSIDVLLVRSDDSVMCRWFIVMIQRKSAIS